MKRRRMVWVVWITLGVLAAAIAAVFIYYWQVMRNTLTEVTTADGTTTIYSVYVLQDDPARTIENTKGYSYGVSKSDAALESADQVMGKLTKVLGEKPKLTEYGDWFSLMDGLKEAKSRAVILNEAYVESISEAEGYEWTKDGIRKLGSYAWKQTDTAEGNPAPEEIPESFVAYISGIDTFGDITARSRSDVNILAAVNTKSKEILMLSTPRDYYVDFAQTGGAKDKLTHAGIYGAQASMDALERLYDVKIDYYLKINFTGFVDVIDALGGVDVYSDYDFSVKGIKHYQKGYNRLNGLEALAFARERYSFAEGDFQRGKNQMEVVKAVIKKCMSVEMLRNYGKVMGALGGSFDTNMPENQITDLVRSQLLSREEWKITSYAVSGTGTYAATYSMPGQQLYVVLPDERSVEEAKRKMSDTL